MTAKRKETSVIFTGPEVRSALAGTKTQFRRVVKQQPPSDWKFAEWVHTSTLSARWENSSPPMGMHTVRCPFGKPGDRLWVREAFATPLFDASGRRLSDEESAPLTIYAADHTPIERSDLRWSPSTQMPRAVSRLTLEVVSVRVEKLQDISEAEARAEGIASDDRMTRLAHGPCIEVVTVSGLRDAFARLWDQSSHGKRAPSWASNPWVWMVEYKQAEAKPLG